MDSKEDTKDKFLNIIDSFLKTNYKILSPGDYNGDIILPTTDELKARERQLNYRYRVDDLTAQHALKSTLCPEPHIVLTNIFAWFASHHTLKKVENHKPIYIIYNIFSRFKLEKGKVIKTKQFEKRDPVIDIDGVPVVERVLYQVSEDHYNRLGSNVVKKALVEPNYKHFISPGTVGSFKDFMDEL